jgi:hypothetical protein
MPRAIVFVVAVFLLFAGYAGLVRLAPEPRVAVYPNLAERNIGEAQHVIFGRGGPPVVLVGSSLASRFQYRTFDRCFRNLALAGQSSLTGLALLAASDIRPRVVLIETNVLHRDLDSAFLSDVEGPLKRRVSVFQAGNRPVNLVTSYLTSLRYPNELAFVAAAESAVDPRVVELGLSLQVKQYAITIDPLTLQARLDEFRAAITRLQADGVQVILFEMPVDPALREAPRAVQIRRAMRQTFPALDYWDLATWPGIDPIRTRDGLHLVLADALRTGKALERRLDCNAS